MSSTNRRAYDQDLDIVRRADARGIDLSSDDARTLRRAELALQRWGERECGDGSGTHIERNEQTGKPYEVSDMTAKRVRQIPDLEAGALRRVAEVCERLGLHYYHQTDPRGCQVYISREPLTDSNYPSVGVACCADA